MKFLKNKIIKLVIFLKFFFPELSKKHQILFMLQFVFFVVSITLGFLHIDKFNIAVYHFIASTIFAMSMDNIISNSFKI
jgi:hypothetical protein|tara:strand:+ start:35 stop:271 length:237 start_codon:yes stop_codon:yes gene_type:complete